MENKTQDQNFKTLMLQKLKTTILEETTLYGDIVYYTEYEGYWCAGDSAFYHTAGYFYNLACYHAEQARMNPKNKEAYFNKIKDNIITSIDLDPLNKEGAICDTCFSIVKNESWFQQIVGYNKINHQKKSVR